LQAKPGLDGVVRKMPIGSCFHALQLWTRRARRAGESSALSSSCAARTRRCPSEEGPSASHVAVPARRQSPERLARPYPALPPTQRSSCASAIRCLGNLGPNAGLDGHLSQANSRPEVSPKTATPRLSALWRRLRGLSAVSALSAPARSRARRGRGSWPRVGRRPDPPRRAKQRARAPPGASPPSRQGRLP